MIANNRSTRMDTKKDTTLARFLTGRRADGSDPSLRSGYLAERFGEGPRAPARGGLTDPAISDRRFAISEKGIALVMSLFILVVIMILGTVFVGMMGSETDISVRQKKSTQALYLAEAGIEYAICYSLEKDTDWSGDERFYTWRELSPGGFSVCFGKSDDPYAIISSYGIIYDEAGYSVQRVIEVTVSKE